MTRFASIEETDRQDKEAVAFGMAAWATIALIWRRFERVYIRRRDAVDNPTNSFLWEGQITFCGDLDEPEKLAVFGVAVKVAECIRHGDIQTAGEFLRRWEDDEIDFSDEDLERISDAWEDRAVAVERAFTLLRDHRGMFESILAHLLQDGVVTSEMIESGFVSPGLDID